MSDRFWYGRRVLVTGHTGFKGAWLSAMLLEAGADVSAIALPAASPSLYELLDLDGSLHSTFCDVRSFDDVEKAVAASRPEVVFHLAAQALVRWGYEHPLETYQTNVLGTVNVLQALRAVASIGAVVVVTSDKCYADHGDGVAHVETDAMGGDDPYSASKGAAELVAASMRTSYFGGRIVATARAGNVIGGGDWARDRLVPDVVAAALAQRRPEIRYPDAIRPWQHVLDANAGYMALAQRLSADPAGFAGGWNFGPANGDGVTVAQLARRLLTALGRPADLDVQAGPHPPERPVLRLDPARAWTHLQWRPKLSETQTVEWTAQWYRQWHAGGRAAEMTMEQIRAHAAL